MQLIDFSGLIVIEFYELYFCLQFLFVKSAASARGKVEVSTSDLHPGIYIAVPSSDGVAASPRKFAVK